MARSIGLQLDMKYLLPSKDHTDALVSGYLDVIEHLHRVIHIPTFKRDYERFWTPNHGPDNGMTCLIMAIISISSCIHVKSETLQQISREHRAAALQWIDVCEICLTQQNTKHRGLLYYQVFVLVYLAKRVHLVHKKTFWSDTGSMIQSAMMDGLHDDLFTTSSSYFVREMKRRLWHTIRELDLQNSLEYGFPTLLHCINANVAPPADLDDGAFDESEKEMLAANRLGQDTHMSYQIESARSWDLRLKISQYLLDPRPSEPHAYEVVLRYTHELTQLMSVSSSCGVANRQGGERTKGSVLAAVFLQLQLKECLIALHRPYLQRKDGSFLVSEILCYHTSCDILALNTKLDELGLQSISLLRSDLLLASLSLVRITMTKHQGLQYITPYIGPLVDVILGLNHNFIDPQFVVQSLEQCVPFMENEYLRSSSGKPWCLMTMLGALSLLKIHLGLETRQRAKILCAQRYLNLRSERAGPQESLLASQTDSIPPGQVCNDALNYRSINMVASSIDFVRSRR